MTTLALNSSKDLYADANGNIATLSGIDAVLQDVCSAIALFFGELWYDTTQGVPYGNILAHLPPAEFIRTQITAAAKSVPTVTRAVCTFTSFQARALGGRVAVTVETPAAEAQTGFISFATTQNPKGPAPWYVNAAIQR